jgi:hypothetical protein
MVDVLGLMATTIGAGALTVIVAVADFELSAALVAVTIYVPAVPGAVYSPEAVIEPPLAAQVTAVLVEPVTVAVNCCVAFVCRIVDTGLTEIATETGAVPVVPAAPTPQPVENRPTISKAIISKNRALRERCMLASLRLVRSINLFLQIIIL